MLQLAQRSLSLWLSVRWSLTKSGGFRDKQIWTPSSPNNNTMDFVTGCLNSVPPQIELPEGSHSITLDKVGRKSCVTLLCFSGSPSQTHHQSRKWPFRNLVCSLYFENISERFFRRIFELSFWYYFYFSFWTGKSFWTTQYYSVWNKKIKIKDWN